MEPMWLETWTASAKEYRRTIVLAALLTTFTGLALLIDRPKGVVLEWLGVPLVAFGGVLLVLIGSPPRPPDPIIRRPWPATLCGVSPRTADSCHSFPSSASPSSWPCSCST